MVKLVLQAFQMSLSACMERPQVAMMRRQVVMRLMAAATGDSKGDPLVNGWFNREYAACRAEAGSMAAAVAAAAAAGVVGGGMSISSGVAGALPHLLARTATLDQAGGFLRTTLRGHGAAIRKVLLTPNGRELLTMSDDGSIQVS